MLVNMPNDASGWEGPTRLPILMYIQPGRERHHSFHDIEINFLNPRHWYSREGIVRCLSSFTSWCLRTYESADRAALSWGPLVDIATRKCADEDLVDGVRISAQHLPTQKSLSTTSSDIRRDVDLSAPPICELAASPSRLHHDPLDDH